ncbi:transmembrane protein 220-like isoform X1 [Argonauta hians]
MYNVLTEYDSPPTTATIQLAYGWEVVWKFTNFIMAMFFFLAAFVNNNDPDWFIWMPVYLLPTVLTMLIAMKPAITDNRCWKGLTLAHIVACSIFSVYQLILLQKVYTEGHFNILIAEEGRELLGLIIIIFWLLVCRFLSLSSLTGHRVLKMIFILSVGISFVPLFTWSLCYVSNWHQILGHCKGMFPS